MNAQEQKITELKEEITGLRQKLKEVEKNNNERSVGESVLNTEERLRLIMENVPGFLLQLDEQFKVTYASRPTSGSKIEDVLGSKLTDWMVQENKKEILDACKKAIATGKIQTCQSVGRNTNRYYTLRFNPVKHKSSVDSIVVIAFDITELKKTENALREREAKLEESEKRFRTIFELAPDPYYLFDLNGNFIDGNVASERLIGYRKSEVIGKNFLEMELLSKKDLPRAASALAKNVLGFSTGPDEFHIKRKNGSEAYIETRTTPITLDGKKMVLGNARDITESKEAEKAVLASERLLRQVIDASPNSIFVKDRNGHYILVNKTMAEQHHMIPDEMIGKTDLSLAKKWLTKAEDIERYRASELEVIDKRQPLHIPEEEFIFMDGTKSWYQTTKVPIQIDDEHFCLMGVATDITRLKLAESRELLMATIESTADGILVIDKNGKVVHTNTRFGEMWRIPKDILDLKDDDTLLKNVLDQLKSPEAFLEKVKYLYGTELEDLDILEFKDGRFFERFSRPLFKNDEIAGRVWSFRDITERKKAENALRESEEKYRYFFENSPLGIASFDDKGYVLEVNENMLNILGSPSAEATKKINIMNFPPLVKIGFTDTYQRCLRDGIVIEEDFRYISHWSKSSDVHCLMSPIHDSADQIIGVQAIFEDISERKRAEQALKESEERFRSVFEQAPNSLQIMSPDGWTKYVNPAWEKLWGADIDALKEYNMLEDKQLIEKGIMPFIKKGFAGEVTEIPAVEYVPEETIPELNGIHRWVEAKIFPIKDETGVIKEVVLIHEDISEKIKAMGALRKSEQQLSLIYESAGNVLFYIQVEENEQYRFISVNRTFLRVTGLREDQIVGKLISEVIPEPSIELVKKNYKKAISEKVLVRWEEISVYPTGEKIGEVSIAPIVDEKGKCTHLVGSVHDITAIRKAEEERRRLEEQVQQTQKLESLGVLAGGIAHDFNNLLMGILGNASMALMELPEYSPALESIKDIELSAQRAAELTNQMLAYSGKGKFVIQPINISRLTKEMIHLVRVSISKKAEVKMNLDLQIPLIEGDINQLRQIIMNLITNASDALEDKEGSIIIASGKSSLSEKDFFTDTFICSEHIQTGEFVYLEVTDTGCGMDEETKSKIFDPFFTTKFTGRGLGLAAVLGIVRGHNGAIKVESESGMGSTFTVLFPVSRTIEETQVVKTEKNYNDWTGNGTILLVDDEESVLKIAKRMLEMIGFSVITASDGKQAIEIFTDRQDEIALIMLDMKMPRMDGPQAFKEIRRIKPDTLILVSSGYTESEAENTFEGDAPVGFIQKPYKFNSLKAKFYEILG